MSLVTNGDFSDGLNGWTVSGAGPTSPTYDSTNENVVFGTGTNDVQDGDRLEQQVALVQGQEYTLTFSASELGNTFGLFGLNVELVDTNNSSNTQYLQFVFVGNDQTNEVSVTFVSNFDDPTLRIRGAFGAGGVNSAYIIDDVFISCFASGCRLSTDRGEIAVEKIVEGDLLLTHPTKNEGAVSLQPVVRVFRRLLTKEALSKNPKLRPVRIKAGALGNGTPKRDMLVSRQHRILVQSKIAERMFGRHEVLVPAITLTSMPGIYVDQEITQVEYFHVLLERHDVIFAEGALTESLFAGHNTLRSLSPDAQKELLCLFPELSKPASAPEAARMLPPVKRCKTLIARHAQNVKPLQRSHDNASSVVEAKL
ncbi:MAG: Hint domain-containing protein [Pseudomonadota bacterium]